MTEFDYVVSNPAVVTKYIGAWIAVVGKEVVATGSDAREVFEAAKAKYPDKEPFIMKATAKAAMLL